MTTPEFTRTYALDTLGEPRAVTIEASVEERTALAKRFDLLALDEVKAQATLVRDGAIVSAKGRIAARVVQACVASGEPVPQAIDESFTVRFVPETDIADDEIEVSAEALDDIAYTGSAVDLGEAVAQSVLLALEPFPRAANADVVLRAAGVLQEGEPTGPSPLAGLADLFKK